MSHVLTLDRQESREVKLPRPDFCADKAVSYAGFYINLDRSPGRRNHIETEIKRHGNGQVYERFSAADGNVYKIPNQGMSPGEMGCFLSHLFLLQQNIKSQIHMHVVEDDAVFSCFTVPAITAAIQMGLIEHFDIVFTDDFVQPTHNEYQKYKQIFDRSVERDPSGRVVRLHLTIVDYQGSAVSYIVNRGSIPKIVDVLVRSLANGATIPLDLAIRNAANEQKLRVGCLFPFVSSFRINKVMKSTITGRSGDRLSRSLSQLGRQSFFVECDHRALCELANGILLNAPPRLNLASNDSSHEIMLDQIVALFESGLLVVH